MGKQILNGTFRFPEDSILPGSNIIVPYVIVGDEAFRLDKHIMKPFPRKVGRDNDFKRIFNHRLSHARRVTENTFGLLSQDFGVFYQPINIEITTRDNLIWVGCCLHNMLRDTYMENNARSFYELDTEQPGPTDSMLPMARANGFSNIEGFEVRDRFENFFNNEGFITWQ